MLDVELTGEVLARLEALGRVGLIMLGSSTHVIFVLGVIFFAVGLTLQAGATGAVKTVKMSAKLVSGRQPPDP